MPKHKVGEINAFYVFDILRRNLTANISYKSSRFRAVAIKE